MCPAFYIFSDHIEIVSYGGLIDGMSKEELISGCSRPRNREIMRIFHDIGLVEQLGTGMEKMMKAYSPDIFNLTPNFFHVELNTTERAHITTGNTTEKSRLTTGNTTEKIFRMIQQNPYITTKELAKEFDMTEDGIFYHIKSLRSAGKIQRVGGRKTGYWQTF